jgi:solute carrier family 9 (sodium/hydrogen exchanger), member 8
LLAVVGTVVSTLLTGYGLYGLQQAGAFFLSDTPVDALLFGSLITATDTVATLAVFGDLHVDRTLYALVFGESILNDAVAITLYQILAGFAGGGAFGPRELLQALGLFVLNFVGSLGIGGGIAAMASLMLKHLPPPTRTWALLLFVAVGYMAYTLAQAASLSGIFSIFIGAFVLKHYAFYNVDPDTRQSLIDLLKTGAFLAETVIYILLGMAFFDRDATWEAPFIFCALLVCLIARAFSVFALSALANLGRRRKVPFNFQVHTYTHARAHTHTRTHTHAQTCIHHQAQQSINPMAREADAISRRSH